MNQSLNVQSKMSIASIDAIQQNIKTWNDNSSAFANINKSLVESFASPFNTKI
jgi:hypothetical protein